MIFAMDGPNVINTAPSGRLARIHIPASRAPGTPPVPAVNVSEDAGLTSPQLLKNNVTVVAPTASHFTQDALRFHFKTNRSLPTGQRASVLPASTATAGATGRRYWNPFVGHN